jgi:hypothetical protein
MNPNVSDPCQPSVVVNSSNEYYGRIAEHEAPPAEAVRELERQLCVMTTVDNQLVCTRLFEI